MYTIIAVYYNRLVRHGRQNNSCSIGHREIGPEMVQFIQRTTQSIEGHRQHRLRGTEFTLLRFLVESHQEEQIVVYILIRNPFNNLDT